MADVTFQRGEYTKALTRWQLVRDIGAGQDAVKARREQYLPKPNPGDKSPENDARYDSYLARAVFYNATQRTLQSLVGAVFRKTPNFDKPAALDYVEDDIDGSGVSIYQQSQAALEGVMQTGRCGLLVDYPMVERPATRKEMADNAIRATVALYQAENIINWRTTKVGGAHKLSLVVLRESVEEPTADGFGMDSDIQYRVLRLVENTCSFEIWRKNHESGEWFIAEGPFLPKDGSGRPWTEIPFVFAGATNNDPGIDYAPLYDLAVLNLAHYRNSADYEDSAFLVGQPQVYMAGLDEHWVKMLEEKGIYFGSRAILPLPEGGSAGILQAQPNTLVKEAMDSKERQMVALGARLIERGGAVKTATEAQSDNEAEHSVLSLAAANVSEAFTRVLNWMARFMKAPETALYTLSQDYIEHTLDPNMLQALVAAWQSGAFAKKDLRTLLRARGVIDPERTDEEIDEELDQETGGLDLGDGTAISGDYDPSSGIPGAA